MKDNFSKQAEGYSKFRPGYPDELYQFILGKVTQHDYAWDCGTGNGQTAIELAKYFRHVFATDISSKQIEKAYPSNKISYAVEPAENSGLPGNMINLVTVSQALHWFNLEAFYAEVARVTRPGGLLAAWTYQLLEINDEINRQTEHFYSGILGKYWDHERKLVDDGYHSLYFPFEEIPTPDFAIKVQWTLVEMEGFLKTWSAVQKFIGSNGYDPVDEFILSLKPLWEPGEVKNITFPVRLKLAYV